MTLADEFAQAYGYKDYKAMEKSLEERFRGGDNAAGIQLGIADKVVTALLLVERRLVARNA